MLILTVHLFYVLQAQRAWIERKFFKRECIHIFPSKEPNKSVIFVILFLFIVTLQTMVINIVLMLHI